MACILARLTTRRTGRNRRIAHGTDLLDEGDVPENLANSPDCSRSVCPAPSGGRHGGLSRPCPNRVFCTPMASQSPEPVVAQRDLGGGVGVPKQARALRAVARRWIGLITGAARRRHRRVAAGPFRYGALLGHPVLPRSSGRISSQIRPMSPRFIYCRRNSSLPDRLPP